MEIYIVAALFVAIVGANFTAAAREVIGKGHKNTVQTFFMDGLVIFIGAPYFMFKVGRHFLLNR
ncbi:MAG: hypothetical protein VW683_10335 [Betaproteobacteria bacterium]